MIVGPPGDTDDLPQDIPVIHAPTPYVWIIGRTQTNGPADYAAVHAVQDGYTLTPLAASTFVRDETYDVTTEPLRKVNAMAALDYLTYAADLLSVNPPHPTDFFSILARLSGLGIETGKPFDAQRFSPPEQRADIEAGAQDALAAITSSAPPTLGTIVDGG